MDSSASTKLLAAHFNEALTRLLETVTTPFVLGVGYSGGLDSTVLLAQCVRALGARRVHAFHVDHGLNPRSSQWAAMCRTQARGMGAKFSTQTLTRATHMPDGIEAWARRERHRALSEMAQASGIGVMALAHHRDDQIETVLLNIGRGAGLIGAAGMAELDKRFEIWRWRPLLNVPRSVLETYAVDAKLRWIEDPSNADTRFRRNAVRQRLMPLMSEVFPAFGDNLLRHAELCRDAQTMLEASQSGCDWRRELLDRSELLEFSEPEQRFAMRQWLGFNGLRAPTQAALSEMLKQCLHADGAYASVHHDGMTVRRYRNRIELASGDEPGGEADREAPLAWRWTGESEFPLPQFGGVLHIQPNTQGQGVSRDRLLDKPLWVQRPRMSARLRRRASEPSRRIKTLFQDKGVPAWRRERLPMIVDANGDTVFVGELGADAKWLSDSADEPSVTLEFKTL